ncbi:Monothiol glutaredoxin-S2 [Orobanche minor]
MDNVTEMVAGKPLVIFTKSKCCISHSIKILLTNFGANVIEYELDKIPTGNKIQRELAVLGCKPTVPAVFIGGELVGGSKEVMSLHLQGGLKPMLQDAGALWV